MEPDFVFIPAGVDPLGRYELTRDYDITTTNLTEGMYITIMGGTINTSLTPKTTNSREIVRLVANQVSTDTGFEPCYEADGSAPKQEYLTLRLVPDIDFQPKPSGIMRRVRATVYMYPLIFCSAIE